MKGYTLILVLALSFCSCKNNSVNTEEQKDYRECKPTSSKWISKILAYNPAPGQFINTLIGNNEAPKSIVGAKGTVSLGGYGGYVDFMFDHSVLNKEGVDFVIHGNGFEGSSEPAIVNVSVDANKNGVADDIWYELKGSEYDNMKKNYSITYLKPSQTQTAEVVKWVANGSQRGEMTMNEFHKQSYYPAFGEIKNELTFTGSKLNNNGVLKEDGLWVLNGYKWGYADNGGADYMEIVGGDPETMYSDKFDIQNAVDLNGNHVDLKWIDFIRVYTAVNQQCGWIGEVSSEICGAISLTKSN